MDLLLHKIKNDLLHAGIVDYTIDIVHGFFNYGDCIDNINSLIYIYNVRSLGVTLSSHEQSVFVQNIESVYKFLSPITIDAECELKYVKINLIR